MARSLEELIILHRTALRYLLARESNLLVLGKKPVNNKIANFIKTHHENDMWTSFLDTLNEDLTRNINILHLKSKEVNHTLKARKYRLNSASRNVLMQYKMEFCGGRMTEAPVVKVEQGELQGRIANSPSGKAYYSFQGIPYAKPPLGSLRFKAPQPAEPWEGVRDATSEGNVSAQIDPIVHKTYIGDENCLFLNVCTPNVDGEFLPVMVFIHGGGFRFGSGSSSSYGGDYLVEKDVVVVTINYRCGALGFLCLNTPEVPGNAGLKDIVQAIRWVKENIGSFGGNSGNITVFGESAGAMATSVVAASPLTKNLISKVIIQSGVALNSWAFQEHPIDNAVRLAKELGCESTNVEEILEFLSTTPVKDIVEAWELIDPITHFYETGIISFSPVVEKEFSGVETVLAEPFIDILNSGRYADIPIMIGSNALEFAVERTDTDLQQYIPAKLHIVKNSGESLAIAEEIKRLYFKEKSPTGIESMTERFELLSDVLINVDMHRFIQYLVKTTNKPIYYYKFDYVGELNFSKDILTTVGLSHAAHADELGYLFNSDKAKNVEPTAEDVKMREKMLRLWTNFAKTGNPTPEENSYITLTWLPITENNFYCLNLGRDLSLITNPNKEKMDFWENLYIKHYKIWDQAKNDDQIEEIQVFKEDTTPVIVQETIIRTDGETFVQTVTTTSSVTVVEETSTNEDIQTIVCEEQKVINDIQDISRDNNIDEPQVKEICQVIQQVTIPPEFDVKEVEPKPQNGEKDAHLNGNAEKKVRPSNEIKMVQNSNGHPKDVIRANDPPEDDLPKNIGVNKFVNFFESLGGKK